MDGEQNRLVHHYHVSFIQVRGIRDRPGGALRAGGVRGVHVLTWSAEPDITTRVTAWIKGVIEQADCGLRTIHVQDGDQKLM